MIDVSEDARAAARALLSEARKCLGASSGGSEPPPEVTCNIALLLLNEATEGENVLLAAFMRAVASSSIGMGLPRSAVRRELLNAFDQIWAAFAAHETGAGSKMQ